MKALDTLRIFVITLQQGSLSAAGASLGLSAATVSRRISALEEELGVQLLDRMSRTLKATESGQVFYQRAEAILESMAEAEEAARTLQSRPEGKLRVHSRTLIGNRLMAPLIQKFCQQYPHITVELILSENPVNIVEQHFDVDIRTGKFSDSSFTLRRLTTLDDVLVASPDYLARHPALHKPQDLLAHNCMTYRRSQEPTHWLYRENGQTHELAIQGNFHCNSGEVLRHSALNGLGIALLAEPTVADCLQDGRLVRVLESVRFTNSVFDNGVFAVFRPGPLLPQKVRLFVDFLSAQFEAGPVGRSRD